MILERAQIQKFKSHLILLDQENIKTETRGKSIKDRIKTCKTIGQLIDTESNHVSFKSKKTEEKQKINQENIYIQNLIVNKLKEHIDENPNVQSSCFEIYHRIEIEKERIQLHTDSTKKTRLKMSSDSVTKKKKVFREDSPISKNSLKSVSDKIKKDDKFVKADGNIEKEFFQRNLDTNQDLPVISCFEKKADGLIRKKTSVFKISKRKSKNIEEIRALKIKNKVVDSLSDEEEEIFNEIVENSIGCIIDPEGIFKRVLDILIMIFVIYSIIISPLELAFGNFVTGLFLFIEYLIEVTFLLEIIINFFIPYTSSDDILIENNLLIAKRYLKGWFLFDLISSIPGNFLFLFLSNSLTSFSQIKTINQLFRMYRVMKMTRIIRFLKIFYVEKKVEKLELLEKIYFSAGITRLINFSYGFLIISHIFSCIWIYIGTIDNQNNWMVKSGINTNSNIDIYVSSLYFFLTTIFTIGYGDITSANSYEMLFNIIIMIFGVGIYSYAVTSLGNIVTSYDRLTSLHLSNIDTLEEIRRKYPAIEKPMIKNTKDSQLEDESLYQKILKFQNYNYHSDRSDLLNFIKDLPFKVKNDLVYRMYKELVQNFKFFKIKGTQNTYFVCKVILAFRPIKVFKRENIFKNGEKIEEMIFVKNGVLAVEMEVENMKPVILFALRQNDYFGVINTLNSERSEINLTVKSQQSELFAIVKKELFLISIEFPDIFSEIFKQSLANYMRIKQLIVSKRKKILKELSSEHKNLNKINNKKNSLQSKETKKIVQKKRIDIKNKSKKSNKIVSFNIDNYDDDNHFKTNNLEKNNNLRKEIFAFSDQADNSNLNLTEKKGNSLKFHKNSKNENTSDINKESIKENFNIKSCMKKSKSKNPEFGFKNVKSSKINFINHIYKSSSNLKQDLKMNSFSDFRQMKDSCKIPTNVKNDIIHGIKKNVKKNLKKNNMSSVINPKQYLMKNFKEIFSKHIDYEKKEFHDLNSKLDVILNKISKSKNN